MSEFKFHAVFVVRGPALELVGMFTSKNDADHFASELPKEYRAFVSRSDIEGIKALLLKEKLGVLRDVLLRLERRESGPACGPPNATYGWAIGSALGGVVAVGEDDPRHIKQVMAAASQAISSKWSNAKE